MATHKVGPYRVTLTTNINGSGGFVARVEPYVPSVEDVIVCFVIEQSANPWSYRNREKLGDMIQAIRFSIEAERQQPPSRPRTSEPESL